MAQGLDGVIAAETVLSDVDGLAGRLVIRGREVAALAEGFTFEEALALLWEGFFDLPARPDLARKLGEARRAAFEALPPLDPGLLALEPIEAVRALLARLPDGEDLDAALSITASVAVLTPAVVRAPQGLQPIAPDPSRGHAEDVLRMQGASCGPAQSRALDAYLCTVIDHGLNASTFAARVVASTRAGLTSSVVAGLSALKGPLHGGAPGPVIAMLDEIGAPDRAEAWLESALDRGERLMGFGHRIYRVRDPRADALKGALRALASAGGGDPGRLRLAEAVERAALAVLRRRKPDRPLDVNVEFYTALLLEALAFPPDVFTCVFAMARTAGWIAHAREQASGGRLIRPQSLYVGPRPIAA
ncbi:MAG: citrate synthase/methylcitrate synthase [Caulobacteraceae bacterium]